MVSNKILIAVEEDKGMKSKLSHHFGHCPYFAIYEIEDKVLKIVKNDLDHSNQELTPVDQIMKHSPDIVFSLGMGQKAIRLFDERGVVIKTGNFELVEEVIENLDNLELLKNGCVH